MNWERVDLMSWMKIFERRKNFPDKVPQICSVTDLRIFGRCSRLFSEQTVSRNYWNLSVIMSEYESRLTLRRSANNNYRVLSTLSESTSMRYISPEQSYLRTDLTILHIRIIFVLR